LKSEERASTQVEPWGVVEQPIHSDITRVS
jgi:hypothetical protein